MTPDEIETLFTGDDGAFRFARWGRALAPVAFGVDDATIAVLRGAVDAVCALTGHERTEADPELAANLMLFFASDWDELRAVPDLDRLVAGLDPLLERLAAEGANQYRVFHFDKAGAIKACFVFLRMDAEMAALPAGTLALAQVAQSMLLWAPGAFRDRSPLAALPEGQVVLRPEVAGVLRAAYDPLLPVAAEDPAHALRLYARVARQEAQG